jgi:hypothetical protein
MIQLSLNLFNNFFHGIVSIGNGDGQEVLGTYIVSDVQSKHGVLLGSGEEVGGCGNFDGGGAELDDVFHGVGEAIRKIRRWLGKVSAESAVDADEVGLKVVHVNNIVFTIDLVSFDVDHLLLYVSKMLCSGTRAIEHGFAEFVYINVDGHGFHFFYGDPSGLGDFDMIEGFQGGKGGGINREGEIESIAEAVAIDRSGEVDESSFFGDFADGSREGFFAVFAVSFGEGPFTSVAAADEGIARGCAGSFKDPSEDLRDASGLERGKGKDGEFVDGHVGIGGV